MIIDLTQIEGASLPFDFTVSPDDLELDSPGFRLTGDVRAAGTVEKRTAQVDVSGNISAPAEIDCTRCLKSIAQHVAVDFRAAFVTSEHFASDREHEVAVEDLDADALESDRLDLKEIVREQIVLNLPEQIFCRADCKGLCPKCGADRNLIDCKCKESDIDPRWAALKDFRS